MSNAERPVSTVGSGSSWPGAVFDDRPLPTLCRAYWLVLTCELTECVERGVCVKPDAVHLAHVIPCGTGC